MKQNTLWVDYVYEDEISGIDISKIIEYSYQLKHIDAGAQISNMGGWHSKHLSLVDIERCEELKKLYGELQSRFEDLTLAELWININQKGSYNVIHDHLGGSILSGVFYLNAKQGMGDIVFTRSRNFHEMTPEELTKYRVKYPAITGKLYVFPASLSHYVNPNKSNEDRISISFNYR